MRCIVSAVTWNGQEEEENDTTKEWRWKIPFDGLHNIFSKLLPELLNTRLMSSNSYFDSASWLVKCFFSSFFSCIFFVHYICIWEQGAPLECACFGLRESDGGDWFGVTWSSDGIKRHYYITKFHTHNPWAHTYSRHSNYGLPTPQGFTLITSQRDFQIKSSPEFKVLL